MRVVDTLLNRSEEVVFRELQDIAGDNNLVVFSKMRLRDVIEKEQTYLTPREYQYYSLSHFDFIVADQNNKPIMVVEYDGPSHDNPEQVERDLIKNDLCRRSGLGILRIHAQHVIRKFRGMTLLRWIVEVTELQKAFDDAQSKGLVAYDEAFDPCLIYGHMDGRDRRFPYWLSAPATQSFHNFFNTLDKRGPKGWTGVTGSSKDGVSHRLSCLYFEDKVLFAKASIRRQDLDFPHYDLLNEIVGWELGVVLKKYKEGKITALTRQEFSDVFERFNEKYNAQMSHSMGSFPLEGHWTFGKGWSAR